MPESRHWTNKSFSIKVSELDTTWSEINKIAEREKESTSQIVVKALREYVEKHRHGNYQTMLPNYGEGGEETKAQFEREVKEYFRFSSQKGRLVVMREIILKCKDNLTDSKAAYAMAERVGEWLKEQGVQVWR